MTDETMSCDGFDARLAEWLEDELPAGEQAAMAAHTASCAECGTMHADLLRLRADAAALPPLLPERDLWVGIAGRIEAPVRALPAPSAAVELAAPRDRTASVVVHRVPRRSIATRLQGRWGATSPAWRMSAAAAALVFATAGVTYSITRRAPVDAVSASVAAGPIAGSARDAAAPVDPIIAAVTADANAAAASASPSPSSAATAEGTLSARPGVALASDPAGLTAAMESTYGREIMALSMVVREQRADVDSATLAILERNLAVIDSAIAQSRAALERAPRSRFLVERLHNALDHKLSLLRRTALLPARS